MNVRVATLCVALAVLATATSTTRAAKCPFGLDAPHAAMNADAHDRTIASEQLERCDVVDYDLVKQDLRVLLTTSRDFWPADFGHYGPLMVRLAWHCSGTYRLSDGRGGCDGGRIRFNPERSWADNTNLDKALTLLEPLKHKFGAQLSWGDLIVLAGTVAIESMGGPVLGFCGGRRDDVDGTSSLPLGPSSEQDAVTPCDVDGECKSPLGATTLGLIYVNAEGPHGNPDPTLLAPGIRDTFSRMGLSDRETVALIGGGHTFGKMHGACLTGPGPDPIQSPEHPWPGTCGDGPLKGKGNNTFTSGFEGPWTFAPTNWTNGYFRGLTGATWEREISPGGRTQWRPVPDRTPRVRMLTADIALRSDPSYLALATEFAANLTALNDAFAHAWYKITSLDMGPAARCRGNAVPPAQSFQNPLPPAPATLPNFQVVKQKIQALLRSDCSGLISDATPRGKHYNGALFVHAAWQCASTFRLTDYAGGCNGAKIRFAPQKDWPSNIGVDLIIQALEPIKSDFPTLSTADLIVLAGKVALEDAGADAIDFVGGRVDALDGAGVDHLAPRTYYTSALIAVRDSMKIAGLSKYDAVALAARPRSLAQQKRLGFQGSYTADSSTLSNVYFQTLLREKWMKISNNEYKAAGKKQIFMMDTDVALLEDPELKAVVQVFATSNHIFKQVFTAAWGKLTTADHFSSTGY